MFPLESKAGKSIWDLLDSGSLTLKIYYTLLSKSAPDVAWNKIIWNQHIPPSKALFVWRVTHGKLPIEESLWKRGVNLPSMCSLCCKRQESLHHLYLRCDFAKSIWLLFSSTINSSHMVGSFIIVKTTFKISLFNAMSWFLQEWSTPSMLYELLGILVYSNL